MFLREKAILHLHRRGIRLIEQEIGVTEMNLTEKEFVKFLSKFDEHPFDVKIGDEVSHIGKGEPEFKVIFHEIPSMKELLTSTSIALGEAYMDGKLEIEGDLYHALNMFLGQMGKFSTDKKALKKLIFSSLTKKNQQKEVSFALHIILFIKFFPLLSIRRSTLNFRTSSIQDQTIDQDSKTRLTLKLSNNLSTGLSY